VADLKEKALSLLSTTTVSLATATQTVLYTVPVGKTCILHSAHIVCGALESSTAVVTIGRSGAATDFVGAQTLTNCIVGDSVIIMPVPHATVPVAQSTYAAGVVIHLDVTTADVSGSTDAKLFLYGTLY